MGKEKSKNPDAFIFAHWACEEIDSIFQNLVENPPQNQTSKELKDRARLNCDFIKAIWESSPVFRKCIEEFGANIRFKPPTSLLRKPDDSALTLTTGGRLGYSGPLPIKILVGRQAYIQQVKHHYLIEGEIEDMIDNQTNPRLMKYFANLTGNQIVEVIKTALLNLVDPSTMGQSV